MLVTKILNLLVTHCRYLEYTDHRKSGQEGTSSLFPSTEVVRKDALAAQTNVLASVSAYFSAPHTVRKANKKERQGALS